MRLPLLTLVGLALAAPAAAQMAYRHVFPDGRIVYSDRPVPGAEMERVTIPPPPTAILEPATTSGSTPEPVAASPANPAATEAPVAAVPGARWPPPPDANEPKPVAVAVPAPAPEPGPPAAEPTVQRTAMAPSSPGADRAAAPDDVRAAERYLAAAQATLEAGREPLPGERTGLAGGGSRLNATYWDRQRQLELAVADAQTRLDRARRL